MEDSRYVKYIVFVLATLLMWPNFLYGYSTITHSAITKETVDFFNLNFPKLKLSDKEKVILQQGSVDEDDGFRYLHHFYDPIRNMGLKNIQLDSKTWAKSTIEQAGFASIGMGSVNEFFSAKDDYSWERAIYEYAWGNKDRGLEALGHILHLIQDKSVPDHTRDDAHPPIFDWGSPYEFWTRQFKPENVSFVSKLIDKPIILTDLDKYFDSMALHSNSNFFSEDTISNKVYQSPVVNFQGKFVFHNDIKVAYKYSKKDLSGDFQDSQGTYTIIDPKEEILSDYWLRLSKQAVLHGAGVVKLFFDEVEKEKQTKVLYDKNRSWFQRAFDATKDTIFNVASVFYGSSVKPADLENNLAEGPPSVQTATVVVEQTPLAEPQPEQKPQSELAQTASEKPPEETIETPLANPEASPTRDPFGLIPIPLSSTGAGGGSNDAATSTTSSTSQTTTTPQDTTGPDLTFSITQCSNSLSSSGCVSTSTIAILSWISTSADLASYTLECQIGSQNCAGFPKTFSATSSVETTESLSDFTIYNFIVKAFDQIGNQTQISKTIETASRPIVINEVAWMATASSTNDEWLELYNVTSQPINFSGKWVLRTANNAPYITLTGSISGKSYYLLERTDDLTVNDIAANQIYGNDGSNWALNNTGENVLLEMVSGAATSTIDEIPLCFNWCVKGDNNDSGGLPKRTMERADSFSPGNDWNNWATALGEFILNGKDASGRAIGGTPKAKNSASYLARLAPVSGGVRLLKKQNSPYLIDRVGLAISQSETLSVEPGVVIKFVSANEPSLVVDGTIQANGSASEPVVFTAFEDDDYGGDMNDDGICEPSNASSTSECPLAGTWKQILINSTSQNSSFSNTLIRYGGRYFSTSPQNLRAMVSVDNAIVTFASTTIEHSVKHGLYLNNSASQISDSTFRSNGDSTGNNDAAGVYAASSSPAITSNTFAGNRYGLYLDGSPQAVVSSNIFTSNAVEAVHVFIWQKGIANMSSNSGTGNGINGIVLSGQLSSNGTTTLAANNIPYVIKDTMEIFASTTLTFDVQNMVVKGYPDIGSSAGKLTIKNGAKLFFEGASASDLVFTSLYDDTVGGDSDNAANSPSAGDWYGIVVESGGQIQLKGFTLRYAGGLTNQIGDNKGAINIDQGSGSIDSALLEKNFQNGIRLNSVNSFSVKNSTIRNHTEEGLAQAAGVQAIGSTVSMENITFSGNDLDIRASGGYSVNCTNCGSPVTSPNPL